MWIHPKIRSPWSPNLTRVFFRFEFKDVIRANVAPYIFAVANRTTLVMTAFFILKFCAHFDTKLHRARQLEKQTSCGTKCCSVFTRFFVRYRYLLIFCPNIILRLYSSYRNSVIHHISTCYISFIFKQVCGNTLRPSVRRRCQRAVFQDCGMYALAIVHRQTCVFANISTRRGSHEFIA